MKKKDNYILLIIIICILVSVLGLLYLNKMDSNNKDKEEETKYYLLKDYSKFFTVNSCINKYVSSLQNNNYDNILKMLDLEYVESNNISLDNISSYVDNLDGNYSFVSKKIYYNEINKNIINYYVKGYIISDELDSISNDKIDKYYIVKFDLTNNLFSITPDNGNKYVEVSNE